MANCVFGLVVGLFWLMWCGWCFCGLSGLAICDLLTLRGGLVCGDVVANVIEVVGWFVGLFGFRL